MIETAERSVEVPVRRLRRWGASPRHITTSISHPKMRGREYVDLVRNYGDRVKEFAAQGVGLNIYGPYGAGKTSLAVYVMKEVMGRAGSCLMVRAAQIQSLIIEKREFEDGVSYERLMERCDLLVIDNLNEDLKREWASSRFEDLMRHRYNMKRPVVITTNVAPANLETVVSGGAAALIRDICIPIEVSGVQWRTALTPDVLKEGASE